MMQAARVHSRNLSQLIDCRQLIDVTSHSLGIETKNEKMHIVIKKSSAVPLALTKDYTNSSDDQCTTDITIYEGENEYVWQNTKLGEFQLTHSEPMKKGTAKISVTFDISTSGILTVSAQEVISGVKNAVTIENVSGFSKEEKTRMTESIAAYREKNIEKQQKAKAINKLHSLHETIKTATKTAVANEKMAKDMGAELLQKCNDASSELKNCTTATKEDYKRHAKALKRDAHMANLDYNFDDSSESNEDSGDEQKEAIKRVGDKDDDVDPVPIV